jgi:capsular polysaccharide biosynthesis protein
MYELNQEFEINFKELAVLLVKRIWIAIIAAILCGAIGTVYASSFITPMYNSRARLYIIGSQNTGVFSPSELSAYENLTRDYLNLIKSRTILEAVIESNDLNISVGRLSSCIGVSSPANTRIIDVTVSYPDPAMAKKLCDSLCSEVQRKVIERMKSEQVTVWDWGNLPSSPASPNVSRYTALGALLGFCLPMALFAMIYIFDDSLITTENVESRLGVNVIGTIPYSKALVGRRVRSDSKSSDSWKISKKQ